jgi:hypothetical protein
MVAEPRVNAKIFARYLPRISPLLGVLVPDPVNQYEDRPNPIGQAQWHPEFLPDQVWMTDEPIYKKELTPAPRVTQRGDVLTVPMAWPDRSPVLHRVEKPRHVTIESPEFRTAVAPVAAPRPTPAERARVRELDELHELAREHGYEYPDRSWRLGVSYRVTEGGVPTVRISKRRDLRQRGSNFRRDKKGYNSVLYKLGLSYINRTWGRASEFLDVYEAFVWNAFVDPDYQVALGSLSYSEMAEAIREGSIWVDVSGLTVDLLANEAVDRFVGALNRRAGKAQQELGIIYGPNLR